MNTLPRPGLTILIYHRVLARPDPLLPDLPDSQLFERQMRWVKRCFRVMPLARAAGLLRQGRLPARAACITFDDGYADNLTLALPILRRHGLSACFFIASGYLDGGRMWNDEVITYVRQHTAAQLHFDGHIFPTATLADKAATIQALLMRLKYLPPAQRAARSASLGAMPQDDLMLSSTQLRQLRAVGMEIGAHTSRHPILARLTAAAARDDIAEGRRRLEQILAEPVTLFAYPNGWPGRDYGPEHVGMVRDLGFEAAVSTVPGVARDAGALLELPRFTPWERDTPRFLCRLAQNLFRPAP